MVVENCLLFPLVYQWSGFDNLKEMIKIVVIVDGAAESLSTALIVKVKICTLNIL